VANLHDNVFLDPLRRPKVITYRLYDARATLRLLHQRLE